MSRRKSWEYTVTCQDCGHESKSKTRNVYRCEFCGSLDIDVDDGWVNYLESISHYEEEDNGIQE